MCSSTEKLWRMTVYCIKLGFEDISEKNVNKPKLGEFRKYKITPKGTLEFRTTDVVSMKMAGNKSIRHVCSGR